MAEIHTTAGIYTTTTTMGFFQHLKPRSRGTSPQQHRQQQPQQSGTNEEEQHRYYDQQGPHEDQNTLHSAAPQHAFLYTPPRFHQSHQQHQSHHQPQQQYESLTHLLLQSGSPPSFGMGDDESNHSHGNQPRHSLHSHFQNGKYNNNRHHSPHNPRHLFGGSLSVDEGSTSSSLPTDGSIRGRTCRICKMKMCRKWFKFFKRLFIKCFQCSTCCCRSLIQRILQRWKYDSPCVIALGFLGIAVMGSILGWMFPGDDDTNDTNHKNSNDTSDTWSTISNMLGYTYFLSWTLSFYPQILTNYLHPKQSQKGVSLDFVVLNIVGFGCYVAYVMGMRYSSVVRREYAERFGGMDGVDDGMDGVNEVDGDNSATDGVNHYGGGGIDGLPILPNAIVYKLLELIHSTGSDINADLFFSMIGNSTNSTNTTNSTDDPHHQNLPPIPPSIPIDPIDPADHSDPPTYTAVPQVKANDVAFAWHALILSIVVFVQIVWIGERHGKSERGDIDDNDCHEDDKEEVICTPGREHAIGAIGVASAAVGGSGWIEVEGGHRVHVHHLGGEVPSEAYDELDGLDKLDGSDGLDKLDSSAGGLGSYFDGTHEDNEPVHALEGDCVDGMHVEDHDIDGINGINGDIGNDIGNGMRNEIGNEQTHCQPLHNSQNQQTQLTNPHPRQHPPQMTQHESIHWRQRISKPTKVFIVLLLLTCILGAMLVGSVSTLGTWGNEGNEGNEGTNGDGDGSGGGGGGGGQLQWIDYLYFLSFVKVGISIVKYIPQVLLNYQRKSTSGWQIWNVLLDFSGGTLSLLQLIGDSFQEARRSQGGNGVNGGNGWTGVVGNPAKLGLGLVSILFDIIFLLQHYVLYRTPAPSSSGRGGYGSPTRRGDRVETINPSYTAIPNQNDAVRKEDDYETPLLPDVQFV